MGYFIDGLREDPLKMKIMRENPQLFQNAVTIATREQNLRRRFQLRTGHAPGAGGNHQIDEVVPMEVDHYRQKIKCNYCHKIGHLIADCRARRRDGQVNLAQIRQDKGRYRRSVVCYQCGEPGHLARECGKRSNGSAGIHKSVQHLNEKTSHM